jgi:hypothetical protein
LYKFQNINLKDAGTKGDLEKDGTSEDGTSFSLIREVKMMMTTKVFVKPRKNCTNK